MSNSRRDFLKKGIGLVSLSAAAPHLWLRPVHAQGKGGPGGDASRVLVVLQMNGGNDGINTVIPYGNGAYYDARETIAIPEAQILDLNGSVGLHPALAPLMPLYQSQKLAVIQGTGYPTPNRSHFRSMEIWQTADPNDVDDTGWLGRFADLHLKDAGELAAVHVGDELPKSMNGDLIVAPSIDKLQTYRFYTDDAHPGDRPNQVSAFLGTNDRRGASYASSMASTNRSAYAGSEELQAAAGGYTPRATYPNTKLGRDMQFAAQIITSNVGTRVLSVRTNGYDSHANQLNEQQALHASFAQSLAAFQADLEAYGYADRVTLLAFSEFGRRVEENGSGGTDHGTAGPMFVMGNGVAGGLYGSYPSLTTLDANGDLIFTVDFRTVYASMLENWMGVDSRDMLGGTFAPVTGLIR